MLATNTSIHEEITAKIIDAIQYGQCPPWRRLWRPDLENTGFPCNIFSMPFKGIALLLLNMAATEQKMNSRFFTTQAAWKSFGGRVSGDGIMIPHRFKPNRWIKVYNADQVSGGEAWRFQSRRRTVPAVADYGPAEAVIAASGATIHHRLGMEAAYYYKEDHIIFPEKWQFEQGPGGVVAFWDSLFHEVCGHWSEPRLGWDCPNDMPEIRELRAELAAPLLASQLGIPVLTDIRKLTNHRNHLGRWIAVMKDDPTLIFQVAADASQAVEYLLSLAKGATA